MSLSAAGIFFIIHYYNFSSLGIKYKKKFSLNFWFNFLKCKALEINMAFLKANFLYQMKFLLV